MDAIRDFWRVLTSDEIWLPKNMTWQDIERRKDLPQVKDLYYAFVTALVLSMLRLTLHKFVFRPIRIALGIGRKENNLLQNCIQENNGMIKETQIQSFARELNCTAAQNDLWFQRKKNVELKVKKFNESAWHLAYFSSAVVYGFFIVWDKSWLTDIRECFPESLSQREVSIQIQCYYLTQLGFYISESVSLMYDVQRKDFSMLLFHHIFALILISVSWLANAIFIGCLVMLCHDIGEVPLVVTKMMKYLRNETMANVGFLFFFFVWCLTKLGYYPFLIFGGFSYGGAYLSPFCYYLLCGLMVLLFCLHLRWTWMIIKIIGNGFTWNEFEDVASYEEICRAEEKSPKTFVLKSC